MYRFAERSHSYQDFCVDFLESNMFIHGGGGLLLDPGLGKTASTLAWIQRMKAMVPNFRPLVIAPLRVMYSAWPGEVSTWEEFSDMGVRLIHGTPNQRLYQMHQSSDLHLINPDGVCWLEKAMKGACRWNALVVDESTAFKNWSSKRMRAIRRMLPAFDYRVILTGTPTPNSYQDLFSQIYILDDGVALGNSITKYRNRYFYRGGYQGREFKLIPGADKTIQEKIKHLVVQMSAVDHLEMPALVERDVTIPMPDSLRKRYRQMERELALAMESGEDIVASNAGSKYNMCRQFASGMIYNEDGNPVHVHKEKIKALEGVLEDIYGSPAIIAYHYRHSLDRLKKLFGRNVPVINGDTSGKQTANIIEEWNNGVHPVVLIQPQSLSHGANMQRGGNHLIWFDPVDSLEHYQQLNARLYRQGQVSRHVTIHRLILEGTVDRAICTRLSNKDQSQSALKQALKAHLERPVNV